MSNFTAVIVQLCYLLCNPTWMNTMEKQKKGLDLFSEVVFWSFTYFIWSYNNKINTLVSLPAANMASLNNNFSLLNVFSRYCVPRHFDKPSSAWLLYAARDGQLSSVLVAAQPQGPNEDWRQRRQSGPFSVHEPQSDGTLLKFPQVSVKKNTLCSSTYWEVPSILSIKS